jgi:hypothetical protein
MISNAFSDSFLDWITASTQWQRYFKVGVCVHPREKGVEQKHRTGSFVGESPIGEGVTGGVSDPDDTGEEYLASVVAAREEG